MFPNILFPIEEDDDLNTLIDSDSSIFHYTDSNTFFTKIFGEKRFRFSNIKLTNDPIEYKSPEAYGYPAGDQIAETDKEFCLEVTKEINNLRNKMCIACFCSNENDKQSKYDSDSGNLYFAQKGYEHSRMWSQYGEDHRGICLVFNKGKLLDAVFKFCEMKQFVFHQDIRYVQKQIIFPTYEEIIQVKTDDFIETAKLYYSIDRNVKKLLFTKDIDYERENEFRVAFYSKNDYEYIDLSSLKVIIIGDRFPDYLGCSICEVADELDIPVVKMNYYGGFSRLSIYFRKGKGF